MNEVLHRKQLKNLMRHGIPKHTAKEIVDTVIYTCNGKNIELYINYAITLKYGFKIV